MLWLLSESPLHGYRIRKILRDPVHAFWFRVEDASIYSCLRTLVKRGLARVVGTEREGRRPVRTRYAITRAGREHLRDLLRDVWREPPAPTDPVQLALAARSELPPEELTGLLEVRRAALEERVRRLEGMERSAPDPQMVRRQLALTRAELGWLDEMEGEGR